MKIPKIDLSKVDKKFFIAIPVILLVFMMGIFQDSSNKKIQQKGVENQSVSEPQTTQENSTPVDPIKVDVSNKDELNDYHEKISGQENNQWNINRGGFIARSGDFYYYADSKLGLLYRVSLDGSKRSKIDHLPAVNNINIHEGWIYYTSRIFDGEGNKVSSRVYKLNMQDQRKIESNIHAEIMMLSNSHIYFTNLRDNRRVYRMDPNFENLERMTEEVLVSNFYIEDGYIYYLTPEGILRKEINGTQKNVEVPAPNIQKFIMNDGWIYYISGTNKNLFTVPVGRPSDRLLLIREAFDMHLYDTFIYYKTSDKGSFKVSKIGDIDIELGTLPRNEINTIIGNVMFMGDQEKDFGYSSKILLQSQKVEPLGIDLRETRLGINKEKINDYVALQIDYDDRNTITKKILSELGSFFEGNSIPYYRQFADIDQNYLNEAFVIFRQYVSEDTGLVPGLRLSKGFQAGLLVFRWEGKRLNILGPYSLKQEQRVANGEFLSPDLKLFDITGNGQKEVVIELENSKKLDRLDIFSVYPIHVEPLDAKNYAFRLRGLGYE